MPETADSRWITATSFQFFRSVKSEYWGCATVLPAM